ncbi:hypothetical protein FE257_001451 [Aspergillus nanangensis]|uniref:Prenyltransferase nanD n=2 Tax=Aspergillus nanangensis TaxID=2582783 RepID=NAND_ASPNN|nr:RecName: Full=Prenyltransferase nanD; AltName: Full=Nanangelenin A biosynthesis cluster protein D [Aspergillus nanangensis]KAF9884566.1 hypothetical protein FE257_001451 [Aspergillus nanangensis]QIQ51364.1 hypothetical protein FE257_001451 [Aspergillus nanangensis]
MAIIEPQMENQNTIPIYAREETPYDTLSKVLTFSNIDQEEYWRRIAPLLGKLLQQGSNYTIHQQYQHLCFYALHVIPLLGPFPVEGRSSYNCPLGGVGAIEPSQNFQKSGTSLRYTFEPTSTGAISGRSDPFNRFMIDDALSRFRQAGVRFNPHLYEALKKEVLLTDEEAEAICQHHDVPKMEFRAQACIAVDLDGGNMSVKLYVYPMLKATLLNIPNWELCLNAIRHVDGEGQFTSATAALETYLRTQCPTTVREQTSATTQVSYIACDLVDLQRARFKVYLFDLHVSFERIITHWTMGGRLNDEVTMSGLGILRELWDELKIPEGRRKPIERPPKPGDGPTMPLFFNYEMKAGDRLPKVKAYLPLVGMPEMPIARKLAAFFQRYGFPVEGRQYVDTLAGYFPDEDLEIVTHHQAFLSFSYSAKTGPYMTIYYH